MKLLITGGAGFIGSAFIRYLLTEADFQGTCVNLDALTYAGNLASLKPVSSNPHFAFEKLDICDADGIKAIFSKYQPAAVVHLAAESHVDRSISGSNVFVQTNVVGTYTLLEAAREYVGLSQEEVGRRLGKKQASISRAESQPGSGPQAGSRNDAATGGSRPQRRGGQGNRRAGQAAEEERPDPTKGQGLVASMLPCR